MADLRVNGVPVRDTFAEAFGMRATRLILTADAVDWARIAAESLTGFATSVIGCGCEAGIERTIPPEELKEGTLKLVRTLLSRAPVALRLGMEAINRGINVSQQEGEIMECDMFGLAATTDDMREGTAAFLEKRKAEFKGR